MKIPNLCSLLLAAIICFSGCSKDDDDNNIHVISNNSILLTYNGSRFYIEYSDNVYDNDAVLSKPPKEANVIYDGHIDIPASFNYKGRTFQLVKINVGTFENCATITSVNIPSTVGDIDSRAFAGCVKLENITVSGNTIIYEKAFAECEKLEKASFSDNVIMYEGVFEDCKSMISFVLPKVLTRLPNRTFKNCLKLTSVTIPDNITEIGIETFRGSGITSIDLPEQVNYIGEYAFENCQQLETVKLPENLPSVGPYAFMNCTNLSVVNIPENCSLDEYAFYNSGVATLTIPVGVAFRYNALTNCTKLTSVTFEKGYTLPYFSKDIFEGCTSLNSVNYEGEPFLITGMFKNCSSLKNFDFTGISFIDDYAFEGTGFEKLELPEGIKDIRTGSFRNCSSLTFVILPESLTGIYDDAFSESNGIREIYSHGTAPRYTHIKEGVYPESIFSQKTLDTAILHRPASSEYDDSYNEAPWSWFKNVVKDL